VRNDAAENWLNPSPKKVIPGFFEKRLEASTAIEKAKYEMNSSLDTLCQFLVITAVNTYEKSATKVSNIIAM
jgi:hypothetical protein